MKQINRVLFLIISLLITMSCVDENRPVLVIEKPTEVSMTEYVNSFKELKTYIDRSANPYFTLGTGVSIADFLKEETGYSQALTNFDVITPRGGAYHAEIIDNDGFEDFSSFQDFVRAAQEAEIQIHGSALCWHEKQNHTYLNNLVADINLPGVTEIIIDFESDDLGDSYPMTGNSTAIVENDPKGVSGKVLHIGSSAVQANQSFPQFEVTLPEGRTLGDAVLLIMDLNATGTTGLHGAGMRMGINDKGRVSYGSASSFGCPSGNWGRGLIQLPFADLKLSEEEKSLTSFKLTVGSATGTGDYYIDNIAINWSGKTIVKTPEEKVEIFSDELERYIDGMMSASRGYIKSWNIVNEPMSDYDFYMLKSATTEQNQSGFYWQDYLGDNYARDVVAYARKYHQEYGGNPDELKLFVNDYGLESPDSDKCSRLIQMINQWEEDGVTYIDGIGTQMRIAYSLDPIQQMKNEQAIVNMFTVLASSKKLIRISELTIDVLQANGIPLDASNLTFEYAMEVSDFYTFIIRKYFEVIPAEQRGGVVIWNPNSTFGLWDNMYNRSIPYTGFALGLEEVSTIINNQ